ncbi:MAG: hypothetical protein ACRDLS_13990, partial [Solirubrobacteraceae bacterium]
PRADRRGRVGAGRAGGQIELGSVGERDVHGAHARWRNRTICDSRVTDGVEQVELEQPRQAMYDAGAQTDLLSIKDGEIQAMNQGT